MTFLEDTGEDAGSLTFAELDRAARAIAVRLERQAAPGDRALLLYPPGLPFVASFLGCLYAGVIAVPAYPPRSGRSLARIHSIVADAAPLLVLTGRAALSGLATLFAASPELAGLPLVATDDLDPELAAAFRDPGVAPGDLAFLQYTSGSVAAPKGVRVSHGNLVHNQGMIQQAFGTSQDSVVAGWLPLYHDMGLIGNVLHPLFLGARTILMAPAAFLMQPRRWLAMIARYRATVSGGPNFAFELAARKISPAAREGLDLSCWRVAFNGAEPVRAETLERFAAALSPCGFDPSAFYPCYGLAEATLFVAGARPGRPPVVRAVAAGALERHRVEPAAAEETGAARRLVGCGGPWGGQEVAIVDPETGLPSAADGVGEIWVGGASVAGGYWNRPEETAAVFGASLPGRSGSWLRTGDLGFSDDGALFVTGRLKDLIILRGRNHYPQDFELAAERSHPALRPGHAAAFALDMEGEERLVLVAEVERRREGEAAAVLAAVRRVLAEEHEVAAHEIVLVRLAGVPMTSSGKVRRQACRQAYLDGTLPIVARSAAEPAVAELLDPPPDGTFGMSLAALLAMPEEERPGALAVALARLAARRLGVGLETAMRLSWLELGLDSLGAVELSHRIEETLGVAPPFESLLGGEGAAEIAVRLLALLTTAGGPELPAAAEEELGEHPASFGQRSLWFLEEVAAGVHNVAAAAHAPRGLDTAALARALAGLVARHPALRTTLEAGPDGGVRQVVHAALPLDFAVLDVDAWEPARRERFLAAEAYRPFDLARGPLLRVRVLELGSGEAFLLWAIHHAATDFWSMALLARELGTLYGRAPVEMAALPPPAMRYSDFARRQEARLAGDEGARLWSYWRQALAGELPILELPTDRPRPAVQTYRGGLQSLRLSPALSAAARQLARQEGATLHAVLLAAWATLLGRWSGKPAAVIGTPAAGRGAAGTAEVVGYFVNLLPLRFALAAEDSFAVRLTHVREVAVAGLAHQDFPFSLMVERRLEGRDPSRPPLFAAAMVLEQSNRPGEEAPAAWTLGEAGVPVELGNLELVTHPMVEVRARFELTLAAAERAGALSLALEHNADLFDGVTAARLLGQLACLLESATQAPEGVCEQLPLLPPAERHQLLVEWTDTAAVPAGDETLPDLFAAQARRTPDAVAVVAKEERVTFRELERRAGQLAGHLRGLGVGPEVTVGLLSERNADLAIGVWGILQSGGAYVPLDPAYPRERLAAMLADAAARFVVTRESLLDLLPERGGDITPVPLEGMAGDPAPAGRGGGGNGRLAYLIYTSGSTGRPKGVAIEHRSAVALAFWARRLFSPVELAGVLASTSLSFDMSVFELAAALVWGGRAILAANALELPDLPARAEVTLVNIVPSAMAALLRLGELPPHLLTVNLGGEALPAALVRAIEERGIHRVLNLYGPSEDTTFSTWAAVSGAEPVPIGRPVDGTRAYLLSAAGTPVPAGAAGHLHLAGAGLARGYLGQPERTAERFLPNPWGGAGERLYQTGDLARHRADGILEYLGRLDQQVKVRGFRIEPAEVEACLLAIPGVREAAVLARGAAGGDELVAFVGREPGGSPGAGELRAAAAAVLPAYMVPGAVITLDVLPRNANGKVDRRALLAVAVPESEARTEDLPGGPLEEIVAGILAQTLGRGRIGRDDDFFALGGHSLLAATAAARMREALGVDLPLSRVFEHSTAAGLAAVVAAALHAGRPAVPPPSAREERGDAPLTSGQERLWFLDRLQPGAAYNMPLSVRLSGPLAPAALAAALDDLWRRHEALRTAFPEVGGAPVQRVGPPAAPALAIVDLEGLAEPGRDAEADRLEYAEARRSFDLAAGPLARFLLLRLADGEHRLTLVLHHIIADGRSLEILLGELAPLYAAAWAGVPVPAGPPPLQLADVAAWERRRLTSPDLADSLAYWEGRLAGAPALELPADRPRPPAQSLDGGRRALALPASLAAAVAALARGERATPYLVLLATFLAQLHRYTGERDLTVGSPVAGRAHAGLPDVVGFLVNTLALRVDAARDLPFRELLARVRQTVVAAHGHADLPFEKVVERLQPARALSHNPIFQVVFALETAVTPVVLAGGVELLPRGISTDTAKFDLGLTATWGEETLALALEHAADLFDATTAERMLGHFATLLAGGVADPARPLGGLPLLPVAERMQVLDEWNRTVVPGPAGWLSVRRQFEDQVGRFPDAPAVTEEGVSYTYRELDLQAGRIGRVLASLGVGPETVVPILARRATALVPAALGVLAAGAAYAPLDPASPPGRLEAMLGEVGGVVVLAERDLAHLLPTAARVVLLDGEEIASAAPLAAAERPSLAPQQLAYLIFTSGSTGVPKAVAVAHGSLANLAAWTRRTYGVVAGDRGTLMAGPAFDVSVWETWSFLTAGASLSRAAEGTRLSPSDLVAWMVTQRLTLAFLPTPVAEMVLAEPWPDGASSLRVLFTGGDRLRRRPASDHPFVLANLYGPSEATVVTTCADVPPEETVGSSGRPPTIGFPISNLRVGLVDAGFEPVPAGVPGELCAGGDGLARGYFGHPDLTAARFVPDPWSGVAGARLYRTGDLARWLAGGEIDFVGRLDHQVKLHGLRIEIGEVEAALAAHPGVGEAVVALRADPRDEARLVTWVVGRDGRVPAPGELRSFLLNRIPAYMVPSALVPLAALPLTANGKVDRGALPEPDWTRPELSGEYVAPRTAVETLLARLWSELLGVERVGIHDSFFELGGQSLKAARLVTRLRETFGVELPIRTLFEAPTVATLSVAVAVKLLERADPRTLAQARAGMERSHP